MYLSSLKINGFKSFPESSTLDFGADIIAIVGPNGCGKTNILDSIRWVLGEQKVSLLRGDKMEEVIFNGTAEMKPLGMAEVSLQFDNSQGLLPIDYETVRITRRLFRSGESEYVLNNQNVRLKDITGLLMNTGIGPGAYSVIELKMIEAILSDKTDDRRFLFEEASGITGYKLRRIETLRKLEAVSSDLIRISDIASEVEKQVNSLKRQASKAERYKKYTDRVKELAAKVLSYKYRHLDNKLGVNKRDKDLVSDKLTFLKGESASREAELEKEKFTLEDVKSRLRELNIELSPIQNELVRCEKDYSVKIERSENLLANRDRLNSELEKSRLRVEELGNRREELQGKFEEYSHRQTELENNYNQKETALTEAEKNLDEKSKDIQPARERMESLNAEIASARSNLDAMNSHREEYRDKLNSLTVRRDEITSRHESVQKYLADSETELAGLTAKISKLRGEQSTAEEKLKEVSTKLAEERAKAAELSNSRSSLTARYETLNELKSSYEGYREGSRAVLNGMNENPGIKGAIINHIQIPEELTAAVESALGTDAELILCASAGDAFKALDGLKENRTGNAELVMDDETGVTLLEIPDAISNSGACEGRLSEKIEHSGHKRIVDLLFGNVVLMNDRDSALEVSNSLVPGLSIVTHQGDYFRWGGIIGGGSYGTESSIIGREAAIGKLNEELQTVKATIDGINNRISSLSAEELEWKTSLTDITDELSVTATGINSVEREIDSHKSNIRHLKENASDIDGEIGETQEKIDGINENISNIQNALNELNNRCDNTRREINEQSEELERAEAEYRELTREVNASRMELLNTQSELRRFEDELNNIDELSLRAKSNIEEYSIQRDSAVEELEMLNGEKEGLKGRIKELGEQKEVLTSRINEVSGELAGREEIIDEHEKALSSLRRQINDLISREHHLDLLLSEGYNEQKFLKQRGIEEYGFDITEIDTQSGGFDVEEAESELDDLEGKISRMGAVNMLALEQYTKTRDRFDFLSKQRDDLIESKDSLKEVISEINKTASEKFIDTFETIRAKFRDVFERLFEGGEADVKLAESSNPLESPIEISARPRGKKILSLAQLSGGERALTAIALLFSIYFVKPSPFCILDEIDAPLDDNNLRRFLRLVKDFSSNTQFIIITHNKLTMEASDIMYGVTMEKPGVSKILSVRFGEYEPEETTTMQTTG
ncbi:MAG: chromosome segregation protein SMC [candidate division Zixibacteria bacterium]|nr:chromosome segregation protein SMC [candidate division Zixibacteria bacterium]